MRGHVRKRGETWTVVYDEGRDEGGRRRQRSKGGFRTLRDAERFLTDTLGRLESGSYATPHRMSLAQYLTREWLPAKAAKVRPLTLESYESVVRHRIVPGIGHIRLQGLSGAHINAFYRELEADGLAVSSRRLTHAVLHAALRDAVRWGHVTRNVADMADPPRGTQSKVRAWTATELGRFLEQVDGERLYALWRLAATTGMRRGELLGLTWRCTDFEGARISVEQQVIPAPGGAAFGPPKSARSRRAISLDAATVDALRTHHQAQILERDFAGDAYIDRDLVFCNELGGFIHPNRLGEWFGDHRKAAGIPTGTLHVLRHTAATLMLTSGIPVHIAAARLGDNPKTVLGTYAHLLPSSDEVAAERVAGLISP